MQDGIFQLRIDCDIAARARHMAGGRPVREVEADSAIRNRSKTRPAATHANTHGTHAAPRERSEGGLHLTQCFWGRGSEAQHSLGIMIVGRIRPEGEYDIVKSMEPSIPVMTTPVSPMRD